MLAWALQHEIAFALPHNWNLSFAQRAAGDDTDEAHREACKLFLGLDLPTRLTPLQLHCLANPYACEASIIKLLQHTGAPQDADNEEDSDTDGQGSDASSGSLALREADETHAPGQPTALALLMKCNPSSRVVDAARVLLRAGADLEHRDRRGRTILQQLCAAAPPTRKVADMCRLLRLVLQGDMRQVQACQGEIIGKMVGNTLKSVSRRQQVLDCAAFREAIDDTARKPDTKGKRKDMRKGQGKERIRITETLKKAKTHVSAKIDARDDLKWTALMHLCSSRGISVQALRVLLEHPGASVNARASDGSTALMLLCRNAAVSAALIRVLLGAGAHVGARLSAGGGETACIQLCSTNDRITKSTLKALLDGGADVSARDSWGTTALTRLCRNNPAVSVSLVRALLDAGADVNALDTAGTGCLTMLMWKSKALPVPVVQCLIDAGADPNECDNNFWTPLRIMCCHNEHVTVQMVQFLLKRGARVNAPNKHNSCHALMLLCKQNRRASPELVQALLDAGANPLARDTNCRTALQLLSACNAIASSTVPADRESFVSIALQLSNAMAACTRERQAVANALRQAQPDALVGSVVVVHSVDQLSNGLRGYKLCDALPLNAGTLRVQPELEPLMRHILCDHILGVCTECRLGARCFFLAVDIVDRVLALADKDNVIGMQFVTCCSSWHVPKNRLQLLGVAAMLVAAERIHGPGSSLIPTHIEMSYLTNEKFSETEIALEHARVRSVHDEIERHCSDERREVSQNQPPPTLYDALMQLMHDAPYLVPTVEARLRTQRNAEDAVQRGNLLKYGPAKLAMACAILARQQMQHVGWHPAADLDGWVKSDIEPVVEAIRITLAEPVQDASGVSMELKAVENKYRNLERDSRNYHHTPLLYMHASQQQRYGVVLEYNAHNGRHCVLCDQGGESRSAWTDLSTTPFVIISRAATAVALQSPSTSSDSKARSLADKSCRGPDYTAISVHGTAALRAGTRVSVAPPSSSTGISISAHSRHARNATVRAVRVVSVSTAAVDSVGSGGVTTPGVGIVAGNSTASPSASTSASASAMTQLDPMDLPKVTRLVVDVEFADDQPAAQYDQEWDCCGVTLTRLRIFDWSDPDEQLPRLPRALDTAVGWLQRTHSVGREREVLLRDKYGGDDTNVAPDFLCPITGELFVEPVVASDGHTYERTAIEQWMRRSSISPISRQRFEETSLRSNIALLSQIHGVPSSTAAFTQQLQRRAQKRKERTTEAQSAKNVSCKRSRTDDDKQAEPQCVTQQRRQLLKNHFRSSSRFVPHHFVCPITSKLLVEPVVASDGRTYERFAFDALRKNLGSSIGLDGGSGGVSGRRRRSSDGNSINGSDNQDFVAWPNHALRSQIQNFTGATDDDAPVPVQQPVGTNVVLMATEHAGLHTRKGTKHNRAGRNARPQRRSRRLHNST
eukprot:g2147.t1